MIPSWNTSDIVYSDCMIYFLCSIFVVLVVIAVVVMRSYMSPTVSKTSIGKPLPTLVDVVIRQPDILPLVQHLQSQLLGLHELIVALLIATITQQHLLISGLPGVAKTTAVKCLASALWLQFHRIQCTPDLLPSDIVGIQMFDSQTNTFVTKFGPIMTNILLVDEINRTTPKVQSALLEAMAEWQVTIGTTTQLLPQPFILFATSNPLDHHGTYPLPDAQKDRFIMQIQVDYPDHATEKNLLDLSSQVWNENIWPLSTRSLPDLHTIIVSDMIKDMIATLVTTTRSDPGISRGASPRASKAMMVAAQAVARLYSRDEIVVDDVVMVALPILRHRVHLHPTVSVTKDSYLTQMISQILLSYM